jgi:hypothetical protein
MRWYCVNILTSRFRLARTGTTAAILSAQATVLRPEVKVKAREELDRIYGNRSPALEDDFPYMKRIVKELLPWRLLWRTVEPTGLPHTNRREDGFTSSKILEGTLVFSLQHAFG